MHLERPPDPIPQPLARAAHIVARDLNLDQDWLNSDAALQWHAGLPPALETRVHWRRHAALWVGIVDRYDLVFLKRFAAADSIGPKSVHYQELLALRASRVELEAAADWVRQQDVAPEFSLVLDLVVTHVRSDLGLV